MLSNLFKNTFRQTSSRKSKSLNLVIAINGVDLIEPGDWNTVINSPSNEQEKNIKSECEALAKRLSRSTGVPRDQIEYYSALQYYRLINLLTAMTIATPDGFIWGQFKPKLFDDKITDPQIKESIKKMRKEQYPDSNLSAMEIILKKIQEKLSPEDFNELKNVMEQRTSKPPKVAMFGQAGVGKTTTICSLVGIDYDEAVKNGLISHTGQGTLDVRIHQLKTQQGIIDLIDLPGYGVTEEEDAKHYELYRKIISECDVIVLVIQATNRAMAQDETMIKKIKEWITKSN
ncbi:MAG: 50S ribosome-binding GTPase [Treponema sp.]|nr:50S ribosome-binding GTPase [Treponema sp.]